MFIVMRKNTINNFENWATRDYDDPQRHDFTLETATAYAERHCADLPLYVAEVTVLTVSKPPEMQPITQPYKE